MSKRLADPARKIEDSRLRVDELSARLVRVLFDRFRRERQLIRLWNDRLDANAPQAVLKNTRIKLEQIYNNIIKSFMINYNFRLARTRALAAKLDALSPISILARGYSITRTIPDATVVKDARTVSLNQDLEVLVARGRMVCRVKGKSTDGKKNF
jgi:exodeoxyribonuclease VII large subunit